MPELPKAFAEELDQRPKYKCSVCNQTVSQWYCEACDEYAFDCNCRQHRDGEDHKDIMIARRRPF